MIDQADEDVLDSSLGHSASAIEATELVEAGELGKARALLESVDITGDELAQMCFARLLERLNDGVAMQAAISDMIDRIDSREASDRYRAFLLRYAERAVMPVAQIEKALARVGRPSEDDSALRLAYPAVRRRQQFRLHSADIAAKINFISIGVHCLPWTLLNRWGLRTPERFTQDINPFCLGTHRPEGVVNAIESDFAYYCAEDQIRIVKTANGWPVAMRKDRLASWGHNKGPYWIDDNARNLRENFSKKAENFRRSCQAENPVFVMAGCHVNFPDEQIEFLPRLQQALRQFTGREKNWIIITNQHSAPPDRRAHFPDESTAFIYRPYPTQNYVWSNPTSCDTAEGLNFDKLYVNALLYCLRRWGLIGDRESTTTESTVGKLGRKRKHALAA